MSKISILVPFSAFLLAPLIFYYLTKYLNRYYKADKEYLGNLKKVKSSPETLKKIKQITIFQHLIIFPLWFIVIWLNVIYLFEGRASFLWFIPFAVLWMAAIGFVALITDFIAIFLFKILYPSIDIKLFIAYNAIYPMMISSKADMVKFNKRMSILATAIYLPTQIFLIILMSI